MEKMSYVEGAGLFQDDKLNEVKVFITKLEMLRFVFDSAK